MKRFLDRLRTLGDLCDAETEAVADALLDVVEVGADTDLARAGEHGDVLHVIVEGWACRYVLLADGRRQIPVVLLPGDLCDVDALAADRLDYSVATVVPCRIARLSNAALSTAIHQHAELGRAFLALACQENAILTRSNVALGRQSAREHIAHFLCELVVRLAHGADPARRDRHWLPLTQNELADVFGLTTVHVNRVLQGLRRDRLIELCRDRLRVLDWPGLVAVSGFDPCYLGHSAPAVSRSARPGRPNASAMRPKAEQFAPA